jgi:prepilin-type N-terminal cleavage/methylation domain-containing protein
MKKAFTLIELVLAIVIIGITFPMLQKFIFSTQKADEQQVIQCVVFETYKQALIMKTYIWDEHSDRYDQTNRTGYTYILHTNSSDNELEMNNNKMRVGSIITTNRLYKGEDDTNITLSASATLGKDTSDSDTNKAYDIDDFISEDIKTKCNAEGYDIVVTTSVSYINDEDDYSDTTIDFSFDPDKAVGYSTNIKMLEVFGKVDNELIVKYRVFQSNIGDLNLRL